MTREYLEFEEPIAQIERQILELESAGDLSADDISSEIEVLKGINHNLFSFKYILVECRDLEKMKVYLKKFGYGLILDLKNYDYLFKKNI